MNDKEEKGLFKGLGQTIMKWGVGIIGGGLVVALGLAYTVPVAVAQNTKELTELKKEVAKVTTVPVLNQSEIKNIKEELKEFKDTQKDNHKETKEAINDLRKQNLKMIELLSQIKRQNN